MANTAVERKCPVCRYTTNTLHRLHFDEETGYLNITCIECGAKWQERPAEPWRRTSRNPVYYTVARAASYLGLTERTIRKRIKDGRLKWVRGVVAGVDDFLIPYTEVEK